MYKRFSTVVSSLLILLANPVFAATVHTGEIASHGAGFDGAVIADGGTVHWDHWNNPDWDTNSSGSYTGTTATPFIFYGMQREGYTVEKGLIPLGISGRSILLPHQQPDADG